MNLSYGIKKLLSVFAAISIAVCCLPFAAAAVNSDEWKIWGDIKYCIDGDSLTIAPKDGMETAAMPNAESRSEVPWYSSRTKITAVTLEDGITHIGDYAFYGFTGIWSVYDAAYANKQGYNFYLLKYPTSLESFGAASFKNCSKLSTVIFPDNLYSADGARNYGEIPDSLFENCSALYKMTTQQNRTSNIAFPGKVNRIGKSAFSGCSDLNVLYGKLAIPNTVKTIDDYAFEDCITVTIVHLIGSIERISPSAFNGCTSLSRIYIQLGTGQQSGHEYYYIPNNYDGAELFNKAKTKFIRLMPAYQATEYTVPDTVKEIGDYAFYSSVNLEKITIPNGVKSIGQDVFGYCPRLSEIHLPKSIEKIDFFALYGIGTQSVDIYYDGTAEDFKKLNVFLPSKISMHYTVAVGDLNSDGVINILDLIAIKKAIADKKDVTPQNDINNDGYLNAEDMAALKKMLLTK